MRLGGEACRLILVRQPYASIFSRRAVILDPNSPQYMDHVWATMAKHGVPPSDRRTVNFSIACPDRSTAERLAKYLAHTASFTATPPYPVSHRGREDWYLRMTSYEAPLSLSFLREVGATVREAAVKFGCQIKGFDCFPKAGGLTSA
jgi:Regulator of ribonuclease activity B